MSSSYDCPNRWLGRLWHETCQVAAGWTAHGLLSSAGTALLPLGHPADPSFQAKAGHTKLLEYRVTITSYLRRLKAWTIPAVLLLLNLIMYIS
jgi:hypothetical protein